MSTKTLRKRVALATVAALGAGVLSLVTTSAANAASIATQANQALAGGIRIETSTPTTAATPSTGLLATGLTSVGSGSATSPDVITATVLTTGTLNFQAGTGAATWGGYYTVSAGGYFSGDTHTVANINGGQTVDSPTATAGTAANSRVISVSFNGAVGSTVTINGYTDSTKATLTTTLTVTLAGASVAGVASAADSAIYWAGASTASQNLTSDLSTGSATTTGKTLYLQIQLNDAYGNDVTSTSGALTVSVSSGAYVGLGAAGTYSTAVSAASPAEQFAYITEATAGAGWSGTVTVTYNGVVMATKSATISGNVSKITIGALAIGKINATVDTVVSYQAYDAAGNTVVLAPSAIKLTSSSNTLAITDIGVGTYTNSNTTTTAGNLAVIGGTTAGSSDIVVQTTLSTGAVVKSNSLTVKVGDAAKSYTVSFDKSKYAPGDIATLKIKFLDSKGNLAASSSSLYTIASSAWNATFSTPQLTLIGSTPTASTAGSYGQNGNVAPDATGVITLKYTVLSTTGNFQAVVDFPTVDGVGGTAQTAAYTIADGATSLNDVLKGIVSLIASINKQIAALAKLVAKKK